MISRRDFFKTSLYGAGALTFAPSYNYLLGETITKPKTPHRFIFIRKSNGNVVSRFGLPTFNNAEKTKEKNKEAFTADLDKHELPDWLMGLDDHKENMTILQGLSMMMCDGEQNRNLRKNTC